jgi:hypothetical protein
MDPES